MFKHYITKYEENGDLFVESWIQINFIGHTWCFSRRKIEILMPKKFWQKNISALLSVLGAISLYHNLETMKRGGEMELDFKKLKARIVEYYGTQRAFSKELPMSENMLSLRMTGKVQFTVEEILYISKLLAIPTDEIGNYFFKEK